MTLPLLTSFSLDTKRGCHYLERARAGLMGFRAFEYSMHESSYKKKKSPEIKNIYICAIKSNPA